MPPNYSQESTGGSKTETIKRIKMRLCSSSSEKLFCCSCPFKEHKLKTSFLRPLPDTAIKETDYKSTENPSPGGSGNILVVGNRNQEKLGLHVMTLSSPVQRPSASPPPQAHGGKQ